jgi:protein associated with RNAse G/E
MMQTVPQTRLLGKKQEYKDATQLVDLFTREFTITFKMTDAYLNYFIFLENGLKYLDFSNSQQTFSPMRLSLLDNEGYLVCSIVFKRPILKSQDGIKLSYSSATPNFPTFSAKFSYFDFDIDLDFD